MSGSWGGVFASLAVDIGIPSFQIAMTTMALMVV
jgi:hypothetical protein